MAAASRNKILDTAIAEMTEEQPRCVRKASAHPTGCHKNKLIEQVGAPKLTNLLILNGEQKTARLEVAPRANESRWRRRGSDVCDSLHGQRKNAPGKADFTLCWLDTSGDDDLHHREPKFSVTGRVTCSDCERIVSIGQKNIKSCEIGGRKKFRILPQRRISFKCLNSLVTQ